MVADVPFAVGRFADVRIEDVETWSLVRVAERGSEAACDGRIAEIDAIRNASKMVVAVEEWNENGTQRWLESE